MSRCAIGRRRLLRRLKRPVIIALRPFRALVDPPLDARDLLLREPGALRWHHSIRVARVYPAYHFTALARSGHDGWLPRFSACARVFQRIEQEPALWFFSGVTVVAMHRQHRFYLIIVT